MEFLNPPLPFAPDGPFYGLVVCYLCQVHGFNEISSRAIRRKMDQMDPTELKEMDSLIADQRTREAMRQIAAGGTTGLLAEPGLHSDVLGKIEVDIGSLSDSVYNDHRTPLSFLNRLSAGGLLILAWETTRELHTPKPIWQFLRHLRNAAAHKGRFTLRSGEPRNPASWRTKSITRDLDGALLFTDGTTPGFIGPGDVLYLLSELEQTITAKVHGI